ncbi:MAG: hypothetical protein PVH19_08265 [Planctomycetia bacterium]|jgi:hypothetical protein
MKPLSDGYDQKPTTISATPVNDNLSGLTLAAAEMLSSVGGPYHVAMRDTFQNHIQQAETYSPGITAGQTYGT